MGREGEPFSPRRHPTHDAPPQRWLVKQPTWLKHMFGMIKHCWRQDRPASTRKLIAQNAKGAKSIKPSQRPPGYKGDGGNLVTNCNGARIPALVSALTGTAAGGRYDRKMTRRPRLELPGTSLHVVQRGVRKSRVAQKPSQSALLAVFRGRPILAGPALRPSCASITARKRSLPRACWRCRCRRMASRSSSEVAWFTSSR